MQRQYNIMSVFSYSIIQYDSITRKFGRESKFGSLAVYLCNCLIKIRQYFLFTLLYQYIYSNPTNFNTFAMVIRSPTTKFNSRQYFQLHGVSVQQHVYGGCKLRGYSPLLHLPPPPMNKNPQPLQILQYFPQLSPLNHSLNVCQLVLSFTLF